MMRPIKVDLFCGGGGAAWGMFLATGEHPDVAVNHSETAIAMHQANHPGALHVQQDIWTCPPRWACQGRPVALLHASPDCRHFSKAKGAAPNRDEKIRDLPWTIVKWAREVRPNIITMENVEEITSWGPLDASGVPIKARAGETWKRFLRALRAEGYAVQHRELRACDYGAPTIRKRLFLIARRDGRPIVWPEPTHGNPASKAVQSGKMLPWRTAAECIDWRIPCPSIFERKRALAEATLHRIAEGIERYVIQSAKPFVVTYYGPKKAEDFRGCGMDGLLGTQTTENRHALVTPYIVCPNHSSNPAFQGQSVDRSLGTVTQKPSHALVTPFLAGAGGPVYAGKPVPVSKPFGTLMTENHQAVIAPTLIQTGYGEREGQSPRTLDLHKPLGTIVAGGQKHALVAAHLAKHYTGVVGQELEQPLGTVTTVDHHSLVAASIQKLNTGSVGSSLDEPLHTVMAGGRPKRASTGNTHALMTSHLVKLRGTCKDGQPVDEPMPTITSGGTHLGEVRAACLIKYYGQGGGQPANAPAATVTTKDRMAVVEARPAGNHAAEVRALLRWHRQSKAAKAWGWRLDDFAGLLADAFAGEVILGGELYIISDIGLRMLQPRELYRAQGFPDSYIIGDDPRQGLSLTKAEQVHMCGNSVSPPPMAALVAANYTEDFVTDVARVTRALPLLGVL